ncbi:MAG: SdpI family protein [Lachnospiraceae bacterium]|nr:SdpI family protein [Lachnospiraceae bacterium]
MWFWWFMLVCDLLIPIVMIAAGYLMWKHSPEKINRMVGYRTARSMKNADTWKFANEYCGRLWWKIGWMMLIPSFLIHIPFRSGSESVIGIVGAVLCTVQCAVLVGAIFPVERALKRNFTLDGIRKSVPAVKSRV